MTDTNTLFEIYKTFIHYGNIISVKELDLTKYGGDFVTTKIIEYNGVKLTFVMVNGEVLYIKSCND